MSHDSRMTNQPDRADRGLPLNEATESEILIGRIVDGEAGAEDHARFEKMADQEPSYWKSLALRQRDMANLTCAVEGRTYRAMNVNVAPAGSVESRRRLPFVGWALTATGWAAVLVLAALWGVTVLDNQDRHQQLQSVTTQVPDMSPEEHLDQYLKAPNVFGQVLPYKAVPEQMRDGRWALRFTRQIEEVRIYDTKEALARDWEQLPDVVQPPADDEFSGESEDAAGAAESNEPDSGTVNQ